MSRFRIVFNFSRPILLFLCALTYALGSGMARYLSGTQDALAFWLGLAGALLILWSANLLKVVFQPSNEPLVEEETPAERLALRNMMLWIAIAALASAAVIGFLMQRAGLLSPVALLFLAIGLLLALAYAVPPVRLVERGFGGLVLAVFMADIVPVLSFLLQAGELHRLLGLIIFPLSTLALAFFIALEFPSYADDLKYERGTFLMRTGWQRAISLHHGLLIGGYLLFVVAGFLGVPWGILWPVFLAAPFAVLQILWLRNISQGGSPVWRFLTANAVALFGLTTYLLTLTFWLR
jgi:1,4-dihydroxy-2-naphthoate octaprenyltransferase